MTGHSRRQVRQQVAEHQQRNPPAPKPANNRVWEQAAEKVAAATHPDTRPLTVEFTALRLLEAMIRKDGRAALTNPDAARYAVHVYDMRGHEMTEARYNGSGQVQVSALPKGLYYVAIGNGAATTPRSTAMSMESLMAQTPIRVCSAGKPGTSPVADHSVPVTRTGWPDVRA